MASLQTQWVNIFNLKSFAYSVCVCEGVGGGWTGHRGGCEFTTCLLTQARKVILLFPDYRS